MSAWHAIETDWVRDLVGLWAHRDMAAEKARLGLPSVQPMFRGTFDRDDEDGSYSSEELTALGHAVERLRVERADLHEALMLLVRGGRPDLGLVAQAGVLLGQWVDEACGDA